MRRCSATGHTRRLLERFGRQPRRTFAGVSGQSLIWEFWDGRALLRAVTATRYRILVVDDNQDSANSRAKPTLIQPRQFPFTVDEQMRRLADRIADDDVDRESEGCLPIHR
jgi:hypothetical protein